MNTHDFYSTLFKEVEANNGSLDNETITSVIGFSAGGPVSLSKRDQANLFVTCELALYPKQIKSSEGLNYELLSISDFTEGQCRRIFTALGNFSMEVELGDGHSIDLSEIAEPADGFKVVQLELYSKSKFEGKEFGIYRVMPK